MQITFVKRPTKTKISYFNFSQRRQKVTFSKVFSRRLSSTSECRRDQRRNPRVSFAKRSFPYPECTGISPNPDPAIRQKILRLPVGDSGEIRRKEEAPSRPLASN